MPSLPDRLTATILCTIFWLPIKPTSVHPGRQNEPPSDPGAAFRFEALGLAPVLGVAAAHGGAGMDRRASVLTLAHA